jgi:hypothetical protein
LGVPLPGGPPNPPPPPNPPAAVQLPLTGALMVTVVAVTFRETAPPEGVDPLAGADAPAGAWPTTATQLPTVTSFDVTDTAWLIAVLLVKVTVTCPVEFCTSMLDADTAAAVPLTPGKAAGEPVGAGLLLLLAAGGLAVAPEPPQAVTASATSPRTARAGIHRSRELRLAADARLIVAPIMMNSQSLWLLGRCLCLIHCGVRHSLRSASMGASRAARVAG